MSKAADYGFGAFEFPRGWFMIANAAEATETPAPVRFFGTDMVLYRGKSGKAHLVEAYCPHMGAHLARNTTSYIVLDGEHVQGDSIRCPFHGWRFDEHGQCDHIPYSDFVPKAACLKTYPVKEFAGTLQTVAVNALAGIGNDAPDQSGLLQKAQTETERIEGLCK